MWFNQTFYEFKGNHASRQLHLHSHFFFCRQVLSIDFDQLSDNFLSCLDDSKELERLIVHLHGVRDGHPGTTNAAWADFKSKHPNCELRLTVIHSYDEIRVLQDTVLRGQMPLSHLKVFFCENVSDIFQQRVRQQ